MTPGNLDSKVLNPADVPKDKAFYGIVFYGLTVLLNCL